MTDQQNSICLFCKIVAKEIPSSVVYEDNYVIAILDISPINFGHTLLLPKIHSENLFDLDTKIFEKMAKVAKNISMAIKKAVKADGINIGMNNGGAAGQVVSHTHIHVIPRFYGDGYELWKSSKNYGPGEAEIFAGKISKELML